ncbi:terminase small subunit [Serratia phage Eta]|uniref:Terminase small subunit n=1 Tax=Serratia phage Eta TaxID=1282995 RepID=R9VYJ8_9CAUD|nr:terminase small subunit [Serratia phage Eta]AGN89485.1 terminase small subunit [Serratia phage Eta]
MSELTAKEEAFAQAYVLGGCSDATAAWRKAHPLSKAKPETQHQKACRMLADGNVKARINALKKKASEQSERDFGVSVEWRLSMLKKIVDAGMEQWHDQSGNARRENLAAARGAIQTINDMLGVALPGEKGKRKSFSVKLRIEDASAEPDDE